MRTLLAVLVCTPALAQTGTLDQVSPALNAWFNASASSLLWQQQVRAGLSGQLEGFEMTFTGPIGGHADLVLRIGDGWNTGAAVWSGGYTKNSGTEESPFFDVTSAGINLLAGDTFVIEIVGDDTGMNLRGSYEDPQITPPQYPEELFLNGPPCYADCGWRLAFRTWMGDGSSNYCTSTSNSTGAPAVMSFSGSRSIAANDLVLVAGPVPNQPGLFIQGLTQANVPLGPGTLCVATPFNRLQFAFGVGNVMTYAVDYPAMQSPFQITAGATWHFQCWYRDPSVGPGYNLSDGLSLTFAP
jgi:hypothetical protein